MWPQSAITNISNCYIAGNVSIQGPDRRQPVFMSIERYHLIFWLEEIYHNFEKYHTISRFSFVGNPVIYFVTVREGEKNIIFPFLCFLQHFSPIMQTPGIWGLQIIKLWKQKWQLLAPAVLAQPGALEVGSVSACVSECVSARVRGNFYI